MPERINPEAEFDVLGDILETLRFRGSVFFRSDLAAPWGIALQELRVPRFHIALSGTCYIGAAGQEALALNEEDIAILPAGGSHWIADSPGRELVSDTRAGEACELGNPLFQDGTITNRLMCGIVHYDQGSSHPILNALPTIIHFPSQAENESVWSVVSLIDREMQNHQQGSSRIADRLVEVLFLQLLNQFVRDNRDTTGFMAALRDRRVHRALTLIHKEPAFPWSLAMLGERVGMSRATLVRRFQDVVGVSPMAYIADWRIMKAHSLIKHSATPLQQVAEASGFASARTLSKAFQRHYGCTPNELRRAESSAA